MNMFGARVILALVFGEYGETNMFGALVPGNQKGTNLTKLKKMSYVQINLSLPPLVGTCLDVA